MSAWMSTSKNPRALRFLDLRTLCFALANKKLSLAQVCILFQTKHQKTKLEEYGKVNTESIKQRALGVTAMYGGFRLAIPYAIATFFSIAITFGLVLGALYKK